MGTSLSSTETARATASQAAEFITRSASALHAYGTATHRVEQAVEVMMDRLGLEGEVFALPTGLFVSIGPPGEKQTSIIRVAPGEINLGKLALLDELVHRVTREGIQPEEGIREVEAIVTAPPRYSTLLNIFCSFIVSATVCVFLRGGWREIFVSGCIGVLTGILALLCRKLPNATFLFEPAAAALSSAIAVIIARNLMPISVYETMLAGLIATIPGLILTTAMIELAMRNLVAGTVRLTWAALIFLEITFGVAFSSQAQKLFPGGLPPVSPVPLPFWAEAVALLIAPLALSVKFNARMQDIGWIIAACVVSFYGSRLGAALFGWEFGGFVGAFCAGAASNIFARVKNLPRAVVLTPALLLLVPGSIGFVSVSNFLSRNVLSGVEAAFNMVLVAMSIVIGLLLSHTVVPSRKAL
ncbi:MAG TPA: threonine/serine exporter family protein [Blastocatellia bacterium]|nr:threonine/serine exporter family protein [Blastocatellia bacterium]